MTERREQDGDTLSKFGQMEDGQVMNVPVYLLRPTQPDDGKWSISTQPIEGRLNQDEWCIDVIHGNHRVHAMKNRGPGGRKLPVRKVPDPYEGHIQSKAKFSQAKC